MNARTAKRITGGPAFPVRVRDAEYDYEIDYPGMTLRDYFAGQALVGSLASLDGPARVHNEGISRRCYDIADAMLKERAAP